MLEIKALQVGYLQTNCYIISDGKCGVVVDPGGDYQKISEALKAKGIKADAVLLTHGHFDHILALSALQRDGAKVYIHENDLKMLSDGGLNLSSDFGIPAPEPVKPDVILHGGEVLNFGEMSLEVIHTPGHTKGGVCYDLNKKYLFSGDTLFCGSYGRTDFLGGSLKELCNSIHRIFEIIGDRIVYSGHGESTTLNFEREYNPICRL